MLPRLIEFIESVRRDDGGMAAEHGGSQLIVPAFPPATTVTYTISPTEDMYAYIGYKILIGADVVPGAFTATVQQVGHTFYEGTISQQFISQGFETFMIVTAANPVVATATNISGLVQYWEHALQWAAIRTLADYNIVLMALDNLEGKPMVGLMKKAITPRPLLRGGQ